MEKGKNTTTRTRECRICKARLSMYNRFDVCQCHKEHPNYNPEYVRYISIEECVRRK